MKTTQNYLLLALAFAAAPVSATPLFGIELAKFSVVAAGYATYGANATLSGEVGARSYVTAGAGGVSAADSSNTANVRLALDQLGAAQAALNNMGAGITLAPTMAGHTTLAAGVYSASALTTAAGTTLTLDGGGADNPLWVFNIPTYLVTGAGTQIEIINAGAHASVVWNTGGYTTLGASTTFLGSVLAAAYISQGAGTTFTCGTMFSGSYVAIAAGAAVTSTNCAATASWGGSVDGLGAGLDIVDGIAVAARQAAPVPVPAPGTPALMLLGLGLLGVSRALRTRR